MKQISILTSMALVAMFTMSLESCSSEYEIPEANTPEVSEKLTVRTLNLKGSFNGYDGQKSDLAETRADAATWSVGDKIYLQFTNGTSLVSGTAVYSSDGWTVSYYGALAEGDNIKCEAYYFENAGEEVGNSLNLSSGSAIYQDLNAIYSNNDNSLTIVANLSPRLGRIRFTGTENDSIWLTGVEVTSMYDYETNKFFTAYGLLQKVVGSKGSTEYIYGAFKDTLNPTIGLLTPDESYTRYFSNSVLEAGSTGYMAIPSSESHNQWKNGLMFTANGIEFKMISVPGYTDGHYCIAETETTLELYNKVINSASTSTSQKPVSSVAYSEITSFNSKLSALLSMTFTLPNANQWVFAAGGGNKSRGYTYSGSDEIDDVAWYSGNSSDKQDVKQKLPNEIGLYDMSGNVGELVDEIDQSSSSSNYTYRYWYGGSYNTKKSGCVYSTPVTSVYSYYTNLGFRFIMPY